MSLTGGLATALAFGSTFEGMGVAGATLGIALRDVRHHLPEVLSAAHIGGWLIRGTVSRAPATSSAPPNPPPNRSSTGTPEVLEAAPGGGESATEHSPLFRSVIAVAVAMGIGTVVSAWISKTGLILPSYRRNVGRGLPALPGRSVRHPRHFAHWWTHRRMSLYIFIVMALLAHCGWELVHLAAPMIVILSLQVALVWLLCVTVSID
jgi:sodium--glutamate symport carrier gltS